ncbi:hypothetical protein U1839_06080 [Sphingomonas sp. RT2P30]|uniref:hypothetical protein n=1 Tax=Parasphingomonas halimpatiens TaxID=3096162 RepID=UPI002FC7F391
MAEITLGGSVYPLARPDDLAARIMASSGISLAEARVLLVGSKLPSLLARAVVPLVPVDALDPAQVGELVGLGDMAVIAAAVAPFYADPVEVPHVAGE